MSGHIKNPLTIIAIFAGLVETSGTVVLPIIAPDLQSIYIWFLMAFPIVLIVAFFLTLNFNHKVLYSPSDFSDEGNFIRLVKATPEESQKKREKEIQDLEICLDVANGESAQGDENDEEVIVPFADKHGKREKEQYLLSSKVEEIERAAVKKVSKEFGLEFTPECIIGVPRAEVLYDGVASSGRDMFALEVKYFKNDNVNLRVFDKLLAKSKIISDYYERDSSGSLLLKIHVVIEDDDANIEKVREKLEHYLEGYNVSHQIEVQRVTDLLTYAA